MQAAVCVVFKLIGQAGRQYSRCVLWWGVIIAHDKGSDGWCLVTRQVCGSAPPCRRSAPRPEPPVRSSACLASPAAYLSPPRIPSRTEQKYGKLRSATSSQRAAAVELTSLSLKLETRTNTPRDSCSSERTVHSSAGMTSLE